jgi:hypothetical protein
MTAFIKTLSEACKEVEEGGGMRTIKVEARDESGKLLASCTITEEHCRDMEQIHNLSDLPRGRAIVESFVAATVGEDVTDCVLLHLLGVDRERLSHRVLNGDK